MADINVKVINNSVNALPKYETPSSAGLDIRADFSRVSKSNPIRFYGKGDFIFKGNENVGNKKSLLCICPGSRALVPTGLFMAIPDGYEAQVRPRSGLALKKGLTVLNTPGTIDADYRGEVCVILINMGTEDAWIEDGERIAQLVFNKVEQIEWSEVETLEETERKGGFGHTGTH